MNFVCQLYLSLRGGQQEPSSAEPVVNCRPNAPNFVCQGFESYRIIYSKYASKIITTPLRVVVGLVSATASIRQTLTIDRERYLKVGFQLG